MLESGLSGSAEWLTDERGEGKSFEAADGVLPGRFGHYEVLEEIGRGGMGIVFRARDVAINRVVALKMIVSGQFASKREVDRFRAEAGAAARLDHPNIVPVYEVGDQDGRPYFSMKFMEGGTLAERLKTGQMRLDVRPAVELVVKITRAIHHAHQRALLHRDIKPGNILLDAQGEPHVSDFGLAKCLDNSEGLTLSGAMLGSPSYMSPEQAAGQTERLTTATDTYSLGALLYQLLTSRPPFEAATPLATMEKVMHQEPPPPSAIQSDTDPDLETICLKCLDKDPQRRYASADALATELERWLRGEPIQARPCPPAMRLWKWTRRQPGMAMLGLISILAIVAFVCGQTIMSWRLSRANTEVRATNTRLSASLYEMRWRRTDEASRDGDRDEAIAWLSYFLRQNPADSVAAARLLSLLSTYDYPVLVHPPLAHEAPLSAYGFNRNGDRLLSVSSGGIIRLWNVQSGQVEVELADPAKGQFRSFALGGEDDRRLLMISAEPKARLWDLDSRHIVKELDLGVLNEQVLHRIVAPSSDRRMMAINVRSNVVAVLDVESGMWAATPLSLPAELHCFALSGNGRLLATGTRSGVQLWTITNHQALGVLPATSDAPSSIQFSEDGRWLVYAAAEKIGVINTVTGEREREFSLDTRFRILHVGAENLILVRSDNGTARQFNFQTGQDCGAAIGQAQFDWYEHASLAALCVRNKGSERRVLLDPATGQARVEPFFHEGWMQGVAVHSSGKVATSAQDPFVRIWSLQTRKKEPLTVQVGGPVWEAQWSPAGARILTASSQKTHNELRLWDAETGTPVSSPKNVGEAVLFAAWTSDGSRFATASQDFTARLWDGETAEPISPPLRHDRAVIDCTFSPDDNLLATGAGDRTVRLWDGRTGKAIGEPLLHTDTPLKSRFSKDGRRLATACQDGTIRVWSVPDGKILIGPLRHEGTCWVATFSPDDRLLLSASADGTARLWNAADGKPALPPLQHEGPVQWAIFSPDGQAIATSTESGIVRVWSTANGQPLSEPMRHPNRVWTVRWRPDGKLLSTICLDGAARIWEPFTGHMVAEPFAHQKGVEVRRAGFSPDGRRFLTSSFDGTIKIWDLTHVRPPVPAPDWLPELAEALGGKRVGAKEILEPVPGDSFQQVKLRLSQATQQDYYTRWAIWMLKERLERPVKPSQQ